MELGVRGWSWMKVGAVWMKVGARFSNTQSLHYQRLNQDKLKPKFQNIIYKHLHYNQQNLSETKGNLKIFLHDPILEKCQKG